MESVYNEIISDSDLCNESYSLDVLRKNINNLNKKVVLRTQKLTAQFCVKYILDTAIISGNQESGAYSKEHILIMQPHITNEEFDKCYLDYVIKGNSINI